MNKLAIQITQIENGWVVALPPSQSDLVVAARQQTQPTPRMNYCATYEEVCNCLKSVWPVDIK